METNSEPGWKQRRIADLPLMTDTMWHVLKRLADAKDEFGYLWLPLPDVHKTTLKTLCGNDWIVGGSGMDGEKYSITRRGVNALKVYSLPLESRRHDDICPTCGIHPVAYYSTGSRDGYCEGCSREYKKRQRDRRGGSNKTPGKPCPHCGIRPVHTTAKGFTHSYCIPCKNERAKAERQRKYQRKLERIAAGEFIPCCTCGEKPVHHKNGYVYDYCQDCFRQYQRDYRQRRQRADISQPKS